jgi:hypothetical protein
MECCSLGMFFIALNIILSLKVIINVVLGLGIVVFFFVFGSFHSLFVPLKRLWFFYLTAIKVYCRLLHY